MNHHLLGNVVNKVQTAICIFLLEVFKQWNCLFYFQNWITYRIQCLCLSFRFYCKKFMTIDLRSFQLISIYSNIILVSNSWLCALSCRLSTILSWPNLFWFCCHFSTACSNSQLLHVGIKAETFYSLRTPKRSKTIFVFVSLLRMNFKIFNFWEWLLVLIACPSIHTLMSFNFCWHCTVWYKEQHTSVALTWSRILLLITLHCKRFLYKYL